VGSADVGRRLRVGGSELAGEAHTVLVRVAPHLALLSLESGCGRLLPPLDWMLLAYEQQQVVVPISRGGRVENETIPRLDSTRCSAAPRPRK
jgi:hypothetical protein